MSASATSPSQVQNQVDAVSAQLSAEDLDKLQEIHELINLIAAQASMTSQTMPNTYGVPMASPLPYTYSFYQLPWGGRSPFAVP
jgi:hypothetical protein